VASTTAPSPVNGPAHVNFPPTKMRSPMSETAYTVPFVPAVGVAVALGAARAGTGESATIATEVASATANGVERKMLRIDTGFLRGGGGLVAA
jgi:hypothetical protein